MRIQYTIKISQTNDEANLSSNNTIRHIVKNIIKTLIYSTKNISKQKFQVVVTNQKINWKVNIVQCFGCVRIDILLYTYFLVFVNIATQRQHIITRLNLNHLTATFKAVQTMWTLNMALTLLLPFTTSNLVMNTLQKQTQAFVPRFAFFAGLKYRSVWPDFVVNVRR